MKLFRAFGLIIFLLFAKTILLTTPYIHFEQTLSQLFQTTTTGLSQTEKLLQNIDTSQPLNLNNLAAPQVPVVDFSYQPREIY